MLELLGGGVLGSLIGGIFRLAPEVLKFWDRNNDRAHELAMFEKQCELEAQRGSQKLQEIAAQHQAAVDTGAIDAFTSAVQQQTEMAKAAGGWAASLSASVRPVVTYALVGVYLGLQVTMAGNIMLSGGGIEQVFRFVMTADFVAVVAGILNYWFLSRTLEKRGL